MAFFRLKYSVMFCVISSMVSIYFFITRTSTTLYVKSNESSFDKRLVEFRKTASELSSLLESKVRIICWVPTMKERTELQKAVLETWGTKCQTLLFMIGSGNLMQKPHSKQLQPGVYMVSLPMYEERKRLWEKTNLSFHYIFDNYNAADYDWILKVDDDVYMIMENLRIFLLQQDISAPEYYGYKYYRWWGDYATGGSYAISMFNLPKLISAINIKECSNGQVTKGPPLNAKGSPLNAKGEDIWLALCLKKVNVTAVHAVETISVRSSAKALFASYWNQLESYSGRKLNQTGIGESLDCCAEHTVSLHHFTPEQIRMVEFFVHRVFSFGPGGSTI